jgi:LmbE family N-acetylglucosaminyl deacetylase
VVPGPIDPDAFGVAAAPPTLVIPCGRFARTKLTALRCHASQFAGTAFSVLSADDAERLLEVEHLHRAPVGAGGPCWLDTLGAPPPRTPPHA